MSSSSVEHCALCADSSHDVQNAVVEVNVVIGVLDVHCERLVVRVVPVVVSEPFYVRFCCIGGILFTHPSVTVNCVG